MVQPMKKNMLMLGALLWSGASLAAPLLPSQEKPNSFDVRICRDRLVLFAIKNAADNLLKTKTILAKGSPDGREWDPEDIHLESVSEETNAVFCSVTISANEVTERIVYIVGPDPDYSWRVEFGGEHGSGGGGHKLFPQSIIVRPTGPSGSRRGVGGN